MSFNAREAALNSLIKWDTSDTYSNIEINTVISRAVGEKCDISLYTRLFLGVIEKKLLLDSIIKKYSRTPFDEIDVTSLNVLRLGLYQLIFTDKIPEYSAVNESVNLAPKKTKGFINAILRSFIRDGKKYSLPNKKWQRISLESSIPLELCQLFVDSYGEEIAEQICTYECEKSYTCLRVNTLFTSFDQIYDKITLLGYEAIKSKIANDIIKTDAPISKIKNLLDTGLVFVQDESSRVATMVVDAQPNEKIWDVCACPGGKTFSIAIDMQNKGELYSSDLHENKIGLIEKGAKRLGLDIVSARVQNAKEYLEQYDGMFDKVLVDAPCSGLGIIFKKPDIKYKSIENIKALPCVQYEILNNCKKYVRKGGILVYSTCTLNRKENEENVLKFLEENRDFEPYDFCFGEIKSDKGGYTFFPHKEGTDGFFVARMKRKI